MNRDTAATQILPPVRRPRRARRGTAVPVSFALMLTLLGVTAGAVLAPPTREDVTTNSKGELRSGWYPDQPNLSPGLVGSGSFGLQFSTPVDGQVYAQPLIANHTLVVATETNNIYGLDQATGAQRCPRNLGAWWNPADLGCGDLTPSIGVTGTPVVDPATNTMYLLSKTYVSGTSGPAAWYAHAVDNRHRGRAPELPGVDRR